VTTRQTYDYIIVGSGIGGLYTALLAWEHRSVLMLTKQAASVRKAKHGLERAHHH
jgi:aspartate oxidase